MQRLLMVTSTFSDSTRVSDPKCQDTLLVLQIARPVRDSKMGHWRRLQLGPFEARKSAQYSVP